jgi:curved DNA-binding protein CbpA
MEIDLNIANYNLDDLLNLFKLDVDFDLVDLKSVKKKVLKFHPDKSGLDKEYFLFFSNVYNILKNLWTFKNKDISDESKLHRSDLTFEEKEMLDTFFEKNKNINFQEWFNQQFEQVYQTEDDDNDDYFNPSSSLLPYQEVEDIQTQQSFRNASELKKFRSSQDTSPLSEKASLEVLQRRYKEEEKEALELAFKIYQKDQIITQRKQLMFSKQFLTITEHHI